MNSLERNHAGIIVFLTVAVIGVLFMISPMAQDIHYHNFSDQRGLFGIPNFMNVFSNIPFVIIGIVGLLKSARIKEMEFPCKLPLLFFFTGVLFTGFGSAYYHLSPGNQTLLWDRLPMAITFMALLSAIITLHMEEWSGRMLLFPLLAVGAGSVLYWYITECNGHGDLRPYIFVQFYTMALILLIMVLYPVKGTLRSLLLPMFGFYAAAKYFEYTDMHLYALGNLVSGHTMKHLFAALAVMPVLNISEKYVSKIHLTETE